MTGKREKNKLKNKRKEKEKKKKRKRKRKNKKGKNLPDFNSLNPNNRIMENTSNHH